MQKTSGSCFIVLPELCVGSNLIVGRNEESEEAITLGVAQEICYYDTSEALNGKTDGGAVVADIEHDLCSLILEKPKTGVWGADCGANDQNVYVAITWSADEQPPACDVLLATDIVRLTLALSTSAQAAVSRIGTLISSHSAEGAKINFIACDPNEAWMISCAGKLWAAQQLKESFQCVPCNGLSVTTAIDKSSANLDAELKRLNVWQQCDEPIDFAGCFASTAAAAAVHWCGVEPTTEKKFSQAEMFETLRAAADAKRARSASVAVLSPTGISCYWFTGTPNAQESVFKPFVFAPQPRVSPLTKVSSADSNITLLHKLHDQRQPKALEHLKALEAACVAEVNTYLAEHPTADAELDELLKDCVEAEVKFYR